MSLVRKQRRKVRRTQDNIVLKVTILLLVVALCGVCVLTYFAFNNYRMMLATVDVDSIYENVYVNGVNVGNMTKDAALLRLKREFIPQLQDNIVTVSAEDEILELDFGDFSARYDFSQAVDIAYLYGKEGSLKNRYDTVVALRTTPYKINLEPKYIYDRENIASSLQPLIDAINIEPLNATVARKNGQFIVTQGRVGKVVNTDETVRRIEAVLDSRESGYVTAVIDETVPQYEEEDFSRAQSLLGTFSTKITPGATGRNTNINTALSKINDVVLYPGEIFSTNKLFGAMTRENGYRPAPVITGGKIGEDLGGGVCQVSSTLYNTVLLAELEVVERRNHSLKVAYVDYGFDATLAGDYIDFKFRNDTEYPVFVEALIKDETNVVVSLYGFEVHKPGRSLVFEKKLVETVQPQPEILTNDPSLPLGARVEKQKASAGYRYNVYKTVFQDGVEIETMQINTSYYRPTRAEVLVGTGENVAPASNASAEVPADELVVGADPAPVQPDEGEYVDIVQ